MRSAATFAELWDRAVQDHPDRPFLRFRAADGEFSTWTYGAFDEIVDDVASRLSEGVAPRQIYGMTETPPIVTANPVDAPDPARIEADDQLGDWATTHLTPAARPRTWAIIDALPRTSVGKIRRFRLTAQSQERS